MAPIPLEKDNACFPPSRAARLFCNASRVGFELRPYTYSACAFCEYVDVR